MSELLEITVSEETGEFRLTLDGEIDLSNASELERAADAACDGHHQVTFDLSAVTYLDSSGVHVIRTLARRADPQRLKLVAPTGSIARDVLDLTEARAFADIADQ